MSLEIWTLQDVVDRLGVDEAFVVLLEEEAVVVRDPSGFAPDQVERIRVCWTLYDELGVNVAGVEVAITLLSRLERERLEFAEKIQALRRLLGA